jgi:hypothetical protein
VSDDHRHSLVLPFDTPAPLFARGFEAGRIWALLEEHPDTAFQVTAHAANAEMFLRMAESTGRCVRTTDLDDEWVEVLFSNVDGEHEEARAV